MKIRLGILGAGGLARELCAIAKTDGRFAVHGFIVSSMDALSKNDSKSEVIGTVSELLTSDVDVDAVLCGIGTPKVRKKLYEEITKVRPDIEWPVLVSEKAVLVDKESITLGAGTIVTPGCILTTNVHVAANTYLNLNTTIGHESTIGAHSVLNPGVCVSGGVDIRAGVLVGTGAKILQYLAVGEQATIGASACVTKSVAAGSLMVGVPAKPRGGSV